MTKWIWTTTVLAATGFAAVAPSVARAQAADSVRRFSLFGGTALTNDNAAASRLSQVEAGGSADFRLKAFPLTLRGTLAFSQASSNLSTSTMRYGTFSLDAVTRPAKGFFGFHPYLLGGAGLATRAEYTFYATRYLLVGDQMVPSTTTANAIGQPRLNWAYLEGGGGLEFGKMFIQLKIQQPVASNGQARVPVSFGFRF